ncbi:MAG: DUF3106 domain-containing protein [Pseudomonadota bacterium]
MAFVLGGLVSTPLCAAMQTPTLVAIPPQPNWGALTAQQRLILAPLASDWDSLPAYSRKKWIGIARRFSSMAPQEQARVRAQMHAWAALTPEQRQRARKKYQTVNQLPQQEKQMLRQRWIEYANLPELEKEKHAQKAQSHPVPKPGRHPLAPGLEPPPIVVQAGGVKPVLSAQEPVLPTAQSTPSVEAQTATVESNRP